MSNPAHILPLRGSAAERTVPMTALPTLGSMLGEQTDGPLAGWPIIADGLGGTVLASPTGTGYHRVDSTLDSNGCWSAVDTFYATGTYKVFRAGYDAQRAARRAADLAAYRAGRAA